VLVKRNVEARKLEQIVRPSNRLSLAVDATSLFQRDHDHPSDSRLGDALDRIRGVNLLNVGLRHNVKASVICQSRLKNQSSFSEARNLRQDTCQPVQCDSS
jgi:hypothetical protein